MYKKHRSQHEAVTSRSSITSKGVPNSHPPLAGDCKAIAFNSMLSLTCKSLFDEKRECRVEVADVTVSVSLIQYICREIPKKPSTFAYAVRNGSIDVLRWLASQSIRPGGWLKENGAPWDERICVYATRRGHMHVLRWMIESGDPWSEHVYEWLVCDAISSGAIHHPTSRDSR